MKRTTSIAPLRMLCPTLIFLFFIALPCEAQKVEAKSDQVWHFDGTDEMVVKGEYFATADSKGVVVLRDVETGKVIASEVFGGPIVDLSFSDQRGCLIVVYESNFLIPALSVEHYDFLNKRPLSIKVLSSITAEISGVDFHIDRKSLLISTEDHEIILYNYETHENKIFRLKEQLTIGAFGMEGLCYFLSGNEALTEVTTYIYDIQEDSLEVERIQGLQGICSDLNNKFILALDDEVSFMDALNDHEFSLSLEAYKFVDGEIPVHDFEFSSNGKYLSVVGGEGTAISQAMTGRSISTSVFTSGFVHLYDVENDELLWKTSQKEYQSKYDVKDVGWTDDENFLVCDENGNIHSYHISEEFFTHEFPLPKRQVNYVDISHDFESILYSNEKTGTKIFKTSNEKLDVSLKQDIYPFLQIFNDSLFFHNSLDSPTNEIHNIVYGHQSNAKQSGINWDETIDTEMSSQGTYFGISTGIIHNLSVSITEINGIQKWFLRQDKGILGYQHNNKKYILPHHALNPIDTSKQFTLGADSYTIIHQLNSSDSTITFIQDRNHHLEFSANEQFVNFINEDHSSLFDLKKMDWHPIHQQENKKLVYHRFDKNTDLAFSLFDDNSYKVWDTKTDKKLISKKLNINDFQLATIAIVEETFEGFDFKKNIKNLIFDSQRNKIYLHIVDQIYSINLKNGRIENTFPEKDIVKVSIKNNQFLEVISNDFTLDLLTQELIDLSLLNIIYSNPFPPSYDEFLLNPVYKEAFFHHSKPFVFIHDGYGSFELFDLESSSVIATLKLLENNEWLAYTPDGLFDGSKQGRNAVYFIYDQEVILYNQIKQIYWEPNLLHKLINAQDLILTKNIDRGDKLYPKATLSLIDDIGTVQVDLTPEEYIGAVSLYINDKEVNTNINLNRNSNFSINILDSQYKDYLFDIGTNKISFRTFNPSGTIASRPHSIYLKSNNSKGTDSNNTISRSKKRIVRNTGKKRPGLYGLFVGTSDYQNDKLDLHFADKDAVSLSDAFAKISSELYDKNRVELKVLTSDSKDSTHISSKENIIHSLNDMASKALPNDIIILFFSGHGLTIDNDFFYLTSTAGKVDLTSNPTERNNTCISSSEINEALRKIKSNKQIMILDACHSGKITNILQANTKASSTTLNKALENLEDKMGVYILASSEANQKSQESTTLKQGLLTFSLIFGMSGEASTDDVFDVSELLGYASIKTEEIGKNLGGTQRPVLGIGQGGNPFAVGTKNSDLKISMPQNLFKFGNSRFLMLSDFSDPQHIQFKVNSKLKDRGAFGGSEDFVYSNNPLSSESLIIAGEYQLDGDQIIFNWNILQNERVFVKGLSTELDLQNLDIISNTIINESITALKNMNISIPE